MKKLKTALLYGIVLMFLLAPTTQAETLEIRGMGVKFTPMVTQANVGDTLAFRNMATHYVESIDSMSPPGINKMLSEMGANYNYTLDTEGVYVFKCPPHWGARMGGIIVVGEPQDLASILDNYMATAEAEKTVKPAKGLLKKAKKQLLN